MNYDAFFASVKNGEFACAYLFQGEEEYIKEKALSALRKRLLPEGFEPLNETVLQNPGAAAIVEAALTLPFMSERRLVVVHEYGLLYPSKAGESADEVDKLMKYLENPMQTTCLVFYCKAAPDARKKLVKLLQKHAEIVRFEPLSDATLARWIQSQARPKDISYDDAMLLAFTAGRELMTLSKEISKLVAYSGERGEITREDIKRIVTPSLECTVFQMVDALTAGMEGEAFEYLTAMLKNGEPRIRILSIITRQYRNLLQLSLLLSDHVPESQIAQRIGIPPFVVRKLKRQAREEGAERLKKKLSLCVDTDYAIKSGKMREDAALDRAMLLLCGRD